MAEAETKTNLKTKREAADFLRCSERTLDRYRGLGLVRAVKLRGKALFREADLETLLKKHLENYPVAPAQVEAPARPGLFAAQALPCHAMPQHSNRPCQGVRLILTSCIKLDEAGPRGTRRAQPCRQGDF